jgi:transposase
MATKKTEAVVTPDVKKPRKKPNKKKVLPPGVKDGRPTKYNDEVVSKILSFVRAGNYIETAAVAAGISKETLYEWLRRGAKKEQPFKNFSDACERAMAEADMIDLSDISKAARAGSWQAAAWRLERRNPKQIGRTTEETERTVKVTVSDNDGKKTTFTMSDIYHGMKKAADAE